MKKVLIFSVYNDFNAMELAMMNVEQGNEVFFLECDSSLTICQHNKKGNCLICKHCVNSMKSAIHNLGLNKDVHIIWLKDIICDEDKKTAAEYKCDFNSVQELKDLTFDGAQVGYGAFSSYVTFSRNVMPDMTDAFKAYINFFIKKEIVVYESLKRLHRKYHFDHIVFHNGRFAQFKPFLEFAKLYSVDFTCTEHKIVGNRLLRDYFENDIPHALDYLAQNVLDNWEKGDPATREEIGRSFFEKRKIGVPAGDKVYVREQKMGEMPEDWDDSVENITIFNSSEDEFCSVSKDYDNYLMFPNQYIALRTIFEHYKDDKTKHFYLRIHPNLKNVPYKSHLALLEFKYDNVTIIPAYSSISSYSLLDNSDKIIIFNSTIGVEAAYWGKPVIALTKYIYWKLGLLYHPDKPDDIWPLIDSKELKAKEEDRKNLVKYGYWLLHPNYPEVSRAPYRYVSFNLYGRILSDCTIMKFWGSYKGHVLLERFLNKMGVLSKFKSLPCTEPYIRDNR